jgi:hypothetical protein
MAVSKWLVWFATMIADRPFRRSKFSRPSSERGRQKRLTCLVMNSQRPKRRKARAQNLSAQR